MCNTPGVALPLSFTIGSSPPTDQAQQQHEGLSTMRLTIQVCRTLLVLLFIAPPRR
jgi:hypothetical protein